MLNIHKDLATVASSWCASNGVLMGARDLVSFVPIGNLILEPAPFSLYPTDFPKDAFDQAYQMGKPFNHIVHMGAQSDWLMDEAIGTASQGDPDFTGKLVDLAKDVIDKGRTQKVVLGILRSDYMLHNKNEILQVELNTIASSFGCLSSKISKMHKELDCGDDDELPVNNAAEGISKGIATAIEEYQKQYPGKKPVVVMVVQPGETNSIDQRDLQFLLNVKYGVKLVRKTLAELSECQYHADTKELDVGNGEIAGVVYYRAGYTPDDYPSDTEWKGRSIVEHSTAIKCPDIFYHIFGAKKVQQALAGEGILEKFAKSASDSELVRTSFAGLYALGEGDDQATLDMALANPNDYVLKPQREGGGNNLYDDELVEALKSMSYQERGGYILMQKIRAPSSDGFLVRRGDIVYNGDCVCELGVFGISLREYDTTNNRIILDDVVGHILRAKPSKTNEGGVAAGYAYLSSPKLI